MRPWLLNRPIFVNTIDRTSHRASSTSSEIDHIRKRHINSKQISAIEFNVAITNRRKESLVFDPHLFVCLNLIPRARLKDITRGSTTIRTGNGAKEEIMHLCNTLFLNRLFLCFPHVYLKNILFIQGKRDDSARLFRVLLKRRYLNRMDWPLKFGSVRPGLTYICPHGAISLAP